MKILVTGPAGFVGSDVPLKQQKRGDEVVGVDNLSDYYDVMLKQARPERLVTQSGYTHVQADRWDRAATVRDVPDTEANVSALGDAKAFRTRGRVEEGVARFVDWFRTYYAGQGAQVGIELAPCVSTAS